MTLAELVALAPGDTGPLPLSPELEQLFRERLRSELERANVQRMSTTPTPVPVTLQEILQAILTGLQIAAAALPIIGSYKNLFADSPALHAATVAQLVGADAHPVTHAIVSAALQ
jgi:hypothetical protein